MTATLRLGHAFSARFGEDLSAELECLTDKDLSEAALAALHKIAGRGSCRDFRPETVANDLVRVLAATALSAPSKSDLQQADIILIQSPAQRARLAALVPTMPWFGTSPAMLVFCGNNRRIRQTAERRGHGFANDHLDAFFNASVDAAIVMATFIIAAENAGLGCCPVSVLRNQSSKVSDVLNLPDHVFAVAGLALGWPAKPTTISPRLGLETTIHIDQFDEDVAAMEAYDHRRQQCQPMTKQRRPDLFTEVADYGWSEDKARQYALPERTDFGAFVRAKGFRLD